MVLPQFHQKDLPRPSILLSPTPLLAQFGNKAAVEIKTEKECNGSYQEKKIVKLVNFQLPRPQSLFLIYSSH